MNRAKIVDYFLEQSQNPDFQIDSIRKEMEQHDFTDEEIRTVVYLVDNDMQRRMLSQENTKQINMALWAGLGLLAVSLVIFIATGGSIIFIATAITGGGLTVHGVRRR